MFTAMLHCHQAALFSAHRNSATAVADAVSSSLAVVVQYGETDNQQIAVVADMDSNLLISEEIQGKPLHQKTAHIEELAPLTAAGASTGTEFGVHSCSRHLYP